MLYLEETVDSILAEEGQTLMGLEFLTQTLGLSMKKIELLFKKSMLEYSKRRPIKETKVFSSNIVSDFGIVQMPDNTLSVRAVRYGVLPSLPRFYLPTFGDISFEYEKHNQILKVWPPITPLKITYTRSYTFSNESEISEKYYTEDGEDTVFDYITNTFKTGTLQITKDDKTMVEVSRQVNISDEEGIEKETTLVTLSGTLGEGVINLNTKEMNLEITDTTAGYVYVSYRPMYKTISELDLGDFVFTKLFASKILEALASLRAQATQVNLHNIDLTTDDLYSRVRILKREVDKLLKSTTSFSSMLNI